MWKGRNIFNALDRGYSWVLYHTYIGGLIRLRIVWTKYKQEHSDHFIVEEDDKQPTY